MHIPNDVLRSPRVTPDNLTPIIEQVAAQFETLSVKVADLDEQLTLEHALRQIGRACYPERVRAELDAEFAKLEATRRTLVGLRAIEAHRDRLAAEDREKTESTDRMLKEERQRAATFLAEQA